MTPDPEAVAARFQACGCLRQVAREFGLSRKALLTRLRWMNVVPGSVPVAPPPPGPPPALSPAQAKHLYEQGRSARSLAREFGCHERTVRRRLAEAGVVVPQAWTPPPEHPQLFRMLALNREGFSLVEIAARCACSPQTVARHLDAAEVERPRRRPLGVEQRREIGACLAAGLSVRKTARRLGLGVATVCRAKEALGLGYTGRKR